MNHTDPKVKCCSGCLISGHIGMPYCSNPSCPNCHSQDSSEGVFSEDGSLEFIKSTVEKTKWNVCSKANGYCNHVECEGNVKPTENVQSWQEEFDRFFMSLDSPMLADIGIREKLKQFISSEIERAVESERKRLLDILDKPGIQISDGETLTSYRAKLREKFKELIKK